MIIIKDSKIKKSVCCECNNHSGCAMDDLPACSGSVKN